MAADLTIEITEKRYGAGAPLFTDFHLCVPRGKVVALLGPSGVGKSSLLRMVAGIDRTFSGSIRLGTQDLADAPGMVFQDPRLLPWLTAVDNVRLANGALSLAEATALLDQVGLAGEGRAFPGQLSGGMQRRVALARALATRSGLLLLDEPFVSLDRQLAGEMRTLLAGVIARLGPTMLLVTHDPEDAAHLADSAVILSGRPVRIARQVQLPVPRADRDRQVMEDYRRLFDGDA
ncbi:ABC transporter ATP-binding protein [Devosia chinhatensis]|uniref:ABC transporter domain-containing protein n=1 Tax=Devosia chinhatensis TaxID=429727 RepID=A0A0F5FF24_9HYPH|nr:ABC transporter ATP-binding protein [Devosia chinhatensis]KKB07466.1 hypothetical protein VE26_11945 [Devosia chinhatensis]